MGKLRAAIAVLAVLAGMVGFVPSASAMTEDEIRSYSPYGVWPDAQNGAIPFESHAWWTDGDGDPLTQAMHAHVGVNVPNARDTTGAAIRVSGDLRLVVRVVTFRDDFRPEWVGVKLTGAGYESSEQLIPPSAWVPVESHTDGERVWLVPVEVKTATAGRKDGLTELRIRANFKRPNGDRIFTTNNTQIYLKNGKTTANPNGTTQNYRNTADPIARGWYTGPEYANASIVNWMALYGGSLGPLPVLSGSVSLRFQHREGQIGRAVVDPDYHHGYGGTVLYDNASGTADKTYSLDTRTLANGVHDLFVETDEIRDNGRSKGQARFRFIVNNP